MQLPVVRYRGFRPDPPPASGGAADAARVNAATSSTSVTAVAEAASAAWRLQQRLEFFVFEDRLKRVSTELMSGGGGGAADGGAAAVIAAAAAEKLPGENLGKGGFGGILQADGAELPLITAVAGNSSRSGAPHPTAAGNSSRSRSAVGGRGGEGGSVAAAKKFPVVLADYLEDTSTIGMVVVDQPGTGMTTALLGFLEWYCRGEAAGGRRVRARWIRTNATVP